MRKLERSFIGILIEDVIAAQKGLEENDSRANRRNLIRTTFAAIEGVAWLFREHVRSVSKDMGYLTPLADMALREQSFSVTEHGQIVEQVRFVKLTTSIRLTVKQAQLFNDGIKIDYGSSGWAKLGASIEIRNRITHPKTAEDLSVSKNDLGILESGFSWLLATLTELMEQTNAAFVQHNSDARELLSQLKRGDPDAIRLYEQYLNLDD